MIYKPSLTLSSSFLLVSTLWGQMALPGAQRCPQGLPCADAAASQRSLNNPSPFSTAPMQPDMTNGGAFPQFPMPQVNAPLALPADITQSENNPSAFASQMQALMPPEEPTEF